MKYIDISYQMSENMAIYPGNPGFGIGQAQSTSRGDAANVSLISLGSHTGTHIDAPFHFISGGAALDEFALDDMCGRAKVIDATGCSDIEAEMLAGTGIEKGDILLFRTDTSLIWNCDSILDDYVTLTYEAADYLAQKGVKLVGIDYLTIERPRGRRTAGRSVHKSLLGAGVLICEGLKLRDVAPGEYEFFCFPLNIKGLDGCPARCALRTDR